MTTNPNPGRSRLYQGWTLAEVMLAMAITSVLSAALMTGATAIQKSFAASRYHIEAQAQQMRFLDQITLDLRQALTVTATVDGGRLMLTLPDYLDPTNQPRDPTIVGGQVVYGPTPRTVAYYHVGAVIYRSEGSAVLPLVTDVADFQLTFEQSGQSVTVGLTFLPKFQFFGTNRESVRASTASFTTTLLRNKRSN